MHTYSEQRVLPHAPDDIYAIIADVDRYAEFLPWCIGSRVKERRGDTIIADLIIGYGAIRETYTSRVQLDRAAQSIRTIQESGPFRHLESTWTVSPAGEGSALVNFAISFEFRSAVLDRLIGAVFDRAARRMVAAFEERAAKLLS